jgi:TRAP transporter TAXI family solute receptor
MSRIVSRVGPAFVAGVFSACFLSLSAVVAIAQTVAEKSPATSQHRRPASTARANVPIETLRHSERTERVNQNTLTVVSGNPNGTYLYLAYDMSAVLDDGDQLRVLPVIGKGGYQNVIDVLHLKGIDVCITQSNIMTYLKKTGELGRNIDDRLAYIAKLYNEEMHILAGPGIEKIGDLQGKVVNFSDAGSGTQFSTRLIFHALGIQAQEINVGQADGYQKVKSGEIAATILIAGKPSGAFQKFKLEPGMKLLAIPYSEQLEADYFPAKLTHEDYPNLIAKGKSIETVAVGAVLAAYNWPRDTDRYRRVAKFVDAFFSKFPEFQKPARHSKWKEANFAQPITGWKRFPAAQDWLDKAPAAPQPQPVARVVIDPQLARALAAKVAPDNPAEQERLFQEFLKWSQAKN